MLAESPVVYQILDLQHLHIGRELAECFVEVVHLRQDADGGDDHKDIGRRMGELVVARECQLQRNAKGLDSHDRYRTHGGANTKIDKGVFLAVDRSDPVDHEPGKATYQSRVKEKPW